MLTSTHAELDATKNTDQKQCPFRREGCAHVAETFRDMMAHCKEKHPEGSYWFRLANR